MTVVPVPVPSVRSVALAPPRRSHAFNVEVVEVVGAVGAVGVIGAVGGDICATSARSSAS